MALASDFFRARPRRTLLVISAFVLAGIAEGFGIVTMIPLLGMLSGPTADGRPGVGTTTLRVFGSVGLEPSLGLLLAIIVAAMLAKSAMMLLAMRVVSATTAQIAFENRISVIRSLIQARWGYFISQPVGRLSNSLISESSRSAECYLQFCQAIATTAQVVLFIVLATLVSWMATTLALVVGFGISWFLQRYVRAARSAGNVETSITNSLLARAADALMGMKPLKAMAAEPSLGDMLEKETNLVRKSQEQQLASANSLHYLREPVAAIVLAVGIYSGVSANMMDLPSILTIGILFYRIVIQSGNIQRSLHGMAHQESAHRSLRGVIGAAQEACELFAGRPAPDEIEAVRLEKVDFSYGDHPVLQQVSLAIRKGEMLTLVGASGAGKTTIADLAAGLQRPCAGRVMIDGDDLAEIDLRSWRRKIGYVPQELFLFNDTLASNITLGNPGFTDDEVVTALKDADAWEFVQSLPAGLDTPAGERGFRFSGGQRQRIALARALIRKPQLLILDEVTSPLDPKTAAAICETLVKLKPRMAILSISHQTSLSQVSDRIFRIADGHVTDITPLSQD